MNKESPSPAKRPRLHDNDNNNDTMPSSSSSNNNNNNQLAAEELCQDVTDVVALPALPDISQEDFNSPDNTHNNNDNDDDEEELMGVSMAQLNASIDADSSNAVKSNDNEGQTNKGANNKSPRKKSVATAKKSSSTTNDTTTQSSSPTNNNRKRKRRSTITGNFITYTEYAKQLNGGQRNSHPPLLDQYLTWQNGKIYCMCCNDTRIALKKHMYRHTLNPSHIENLAIMKQTELMRKEQGLPMSDKEGYISYKEYVLQLTGGMMKKHPPITDQCLTWREGKVTCMACNNIPIKLSKHMFRHTESASHKKNLERAKVTKMPLHQDIIGIEDETTTIIENYITYGDYLAQLKGGDRNAHPNLEHEYLTWENGKIRCMCCNTRIKHKKHMYRHTLNPTHQRKAEQVRSGTMPPFLEPPEEKAAREAARKQAHKEALESGYIPWNDYVTQVKGGKRNGHPSIEDQGFKWDDGTVTCTVCNVKIGLKKHFYRHTQTANHKKSLEEARGSGVALHQDVLLLQQQEIDDQAVAESLTDMAALNSKKKFFITDAEVAEMEKAKKKPTKRRMEDPEYISREAFLIQLNGGLRNSHPSIEDQGLVWQDGTVHCSFCKVQIGLKKHMFRHTQAPRHKRKMEKAKNGEMSDNDGPSLLEDRCIVVKPKAKGTSPKGKKAAAALKSAEGETGSVASSEFKNDEGAAMKQAAVEQPQDEGGANREDGYIPHGDFLTQLKGGKRKSHPSIEDQGLKWENGKIHCTCCDMKIGLKKHMYRHTQTALHKKMRELTRAVSLHHESLKSASPRAQVEEASNATTDATTSTTKLLGDFINQTSATEPSEPTTPVKDYKRGKLEGDDYIPYEQYLVQLKGGARKSNPSIEDQGLTWRDGKVICTCCAVRIGLKKHMYRHTQTASHLRNLNLARARLSGFPREDATVDNAAAKATTETTNNAAAKSASTEATKNTAAQPTTEATSNATDNMNVPIETIGYHV